MLGTFITDMNLGIYTAKLDRSRTILATSESIKARYHQYADVEFGDYLNALTRLGSSGQKLAPKRFKHPNPQGGQQQEPGAPLPGRRPDLLPQPGILIRRDVQRRLGPHHQIG